MEFLYFDPYRNLTPRLQRALRGEHLDVCDQIIYHLVAVKPPMTGDGFLRAADEMQPYIPEWIEPRRGRCSERLGQGVRRWLREVSSMLRP